MEFPEQLGIYQQFFDENYNLCYTVGKDGFYVFQSNDATPHDAVVKRMALNCDCWVYKEVFKKPMIVPIMFIHELAIIHLFKNLDLPF